MLFTCVRSNESNKLLIITLVYFRTHAGKCGSVGQTLGQDEQYDRAGDEIFTLTFDINLHKVTFLYNILFHLKALTLSHVLADNQTNEMVSEEASSDLN